MRASGAPAVRRETSVGVVTAGELATYAGSRYVPLAGGTILQVPLHPVSQAEAELTMKRMIYNN